MADFLKLVYETTHGNFWDLKKRRSFSKELLRRVNPNSICDRLWENRAQRGVRNIEKRSIDFFKMYCFKPTEGNG